MDARSHRHSPWQLSARELVPHGSASNPVLFEDLFCGGMEGPQPSGSQRCATSPGAKPPTQVRVTRFREGLDIRKKHFPSKDPDRLMNGMNQPITPSLNPRREAKPGDIPGNYLE